MGIEDNIEKRRITDAEIIRRLQNNDRVAASEFYRSCYSYYMAKHSGVFGFSSKSHELVDVFQDAFLKLWTEIESKRIFTNGNSTYRIDKDGNVRLMKASLKTFLMEIAKNKNLEIIREDKIYVAGDIDSVGDMALEEEPEFTREDIVRLCIESLPQRCKDILRLFYYEGKKLDEIMAIRKENVSKDGLKSGKSKCMSMLKKRILEGFEKYHIKA